VGDSKSDELSKGEHTDQEIACVDCDVTFLFSAAEAAFFAERELAVPRRCRACRSARKRRQASRQAAGGPQSRSPRTSSPRDSPPDSPDVSPRRPRYTGDVNEYRSPMPDPAFPRYTPQGHPQADRGEAAGGEAGRTDANRRPAGNRRRPRARSFAITCQACGADAEVPFRPREGREIFCSTCYRARKQAANDS